MSKYLIDLRRQADKFLQKAPNFISLKLERVIDDLRENPFLGVKMQGQYEHCRKIVVSNYRVVYEVLEDRKIIKIKEIESRGNVSYDR